MPPANPTTLATLTRLAHQHGFIVLGVAPAKPDPVLAKNLNTFLAKNYHGEMTWLATTQDRRSSPQAMWDEAKSAIVLGVNYAPTQNPMHNLTAKQHGNISVYARGKDYHQIIKTRLKQMASAFANASSSEIKGKARGEGKTTPPNKKQIKVKVFVDTAPLMEKPLAAKAGIGWQGKHTNLVSRQHGSWLFLAVILTDADLALSQPSQAHKNYCGSCTHCLDICPTNAFPQPYQLDARRCLSYLTIEYHGVIAEEFRQPLGNRIFGCDDCLAVCPWNRFASASRETWLGVGETMPPLAELLKLDDKSFRQKFAATAIKRTGFTRFMRNVLIATGNSGDPCLVPAITPYLTHHEALLRGMAVWAMRQLLPQAEFKRLATQYNYTNETDTHVQSEWQAGLQ